MIKREIYTNFNKENHFKTVMHFFNEKNVQRLIKPEKNYNAKYNNINSSFFIYHLPSQNPSEQNIL